ncbi:amino acid adenylation domain-containing protein [Sphaerisporangium sp. NPDC051017]|uniref:amino acid adenylation domain-containing protein n=1 Tax=Sphaerisporangium sp. NPDC051017 TaxID=3154636 RepID=UPI003419FF35
MTSTAPHTPTPAAPVVLTEAEAVLWRYQQLHPLTCAYNICAAVEIEGRLDAELLQTAVAAVIARHRTLHSTVVEAGERLAWHRASVEPRWRTVPVTAQDVREWAKGPGASWVRAEARRPFLPGEVLHRLVLWSLQQAGALLQITLHHCACDGLGLRLLVDEMIATYRELADGIAAKPAEREVLPYQPLVSPVEAAAFFAPRLELAESKALLPRGRNRARAADDAGVLVRRVLKVTVNDVAARARETRVSPFAVVMAGLGVALARFSGERDLAVRVPFSHRPPAEDTEASYRVRALPVRLSVTRGDTVAGLLTDAGGELLQAAVHADWGETDAPFAATVTPGGTSVTVVNQMHPTGLLTHFRPPFLQADGLRWRPYLVANGTAKFDLSIHVAAHEGRLALAFEYRANTVDRTEREWFADLVAAMVTDAATADLDQTAAMLGRSASSRGKACGRQLRQRDGRVEDPFFACAAREPSRIAVIDHTPTGANAVTYAQLAAASLAVAEHLTGLGAGAGLAVAVRLPRGGTLIAAVHGVLRAGSVLLLLDPDLPPARAEFMLADSRAHLIIEPGPAESPDTLRVLDQTLQVTVLTDRPEPVPLTRDGAAADAAYVMYTSGSTGRPKGVAVSHPGIINRLAWMQRAHPIGPGNVVLAKTPLSFDVCLWELLWPPMTGATLVTAQHGRHADPAYLCDVLDRYAVDTVHFVPAMLAAFLDTAAGRRLPALKRVFTSGERLPLTLARRAHAQLGAGLHNLYGPTEASIDVTCFTYWPGDGRAFVPIGRPVDNTTVRICDEDGREVSLGAPGELVIEGVQVALGYVGDGTQDEGRFGVNPDSGHRIYRTGDLVRWRSGGVLEFLGRADDQVKINGQRVELEEIDAILAGHPDLAAAAAYCGEEAGPRRLRAFVVPRDGAELTAADLRGHVAHHLAAALIPSVFTVVEALPYSESGKLDRTQLSRLPGRDLPAATGRTVTGEAAELLASAVRDVLGEAEVPADVDLFHLGLDSITALRLVGVLRRRGAVLEVADVFEARTLAALAARLRPAPTWEPDASAQVESAAPAGSVVWNGHRVMARFPLSQAQLGLVYHRQASDDYLTYLTSYELDGPVDPALLRQALTVVAGWHEFLRSALDLSDPSGPQQLVLQPVELKLIEHDLGALGETQQRTAWERWVAKIRTRPFAWDTPPLFAFHLHRFTPSQAVFSIVEPFLDGWSVAVLGRDILDTYETFAAARAGTPPPATVQLLDSRPALSYGRFVALEAAAAADQEALDHWRTLLEEQETVWRLALAPGSEEEPTTWHRWDHYFDEANLSGLRAAAGRLGASLRTLMWAVHMRTVALFTGSARSGSVVMVNGRLEDSGAEDMVGLFLNMLPAAVEIGPDTTWRDLVGQVVAAERSSWRYRRTPYARLRSLVPGFEPSCVFNYTEFHRYRDLFDDPGRALRLRQVTALDQTYLDLTVQCSLDPAGRRLRLSVDHRSPAVTVADARRFLDCLVHAARAAARDVDAPVESDRLPVAELARLDEVGRGPVRTWPEELSLARVVDEHAADRPGAVAIEDGSESYTYAELAALSRHYAHNIRKHADEAHPVVGVMASRSARYWAAVLGIWRAGGTYVALAPDLPAERLSHMTDQAGLRLVYLDPRDTSIDTTLLPEGVRRLSLEALPAEPVPELGQQQLAEAAYVLFTSGSTGHPKGARVGPAAMVNHWWAKTDLLGLDQTCVVGQSAPASFDVSIWQFAATWMRGGRVVVLDDTLLLNPARLFDALDERGVRLFETVPSHLAALLDAIECGAVRPWPRPRGELTWLMVTGEAVSAEVCRRWLRAGGAPIINAYGPTECADDITHQVIDDPGITGAVPIGRPIPNIVCRVTDEQGQPVPLGVEGELRVTGSCLGLGYLEPGDEPGRFLRDQQHQVVAYRTGDRVRFTENGELLWLGRMDAEVKVRGRRIELGDIETHLRTHPAVKETAATVLRERGGRLRAVVVPRARHAVDGPELRAYLAAHVPAWMLPDEITLAEQMPLTAHGKLDRNALATAHFTPALTAAPPPGGKGTHRRVAVICAEEWAQITGRTPTPDSDFFAEGGSSLDSVRLTARISARLGRTVTVADLLHTPRFADLIAHLAPPDNGPTLAVGRMPAAVAGVVTAALDDPDKLLELVPGGCLDGAAVGYLTPAALARAGHQAQDVLDRLGGAPVLRRVVCTPLGMVGHYLLPLVGDDIFTAPDRLAGLIAQAAEHAHRYGAARTVLTGLIPAASKYGTALPPLATEVTTGHDVTTAAVVLNLARALRTIGTDMRRRHVAVIGLGSIGRAATELLLTVLGHPACLTLVESPTAEHRLHATVQAVRGAGYGGPLTAVTASPEEVTGQVASAGVIVGAANATGLLEVEHLAPGTIVIDDSAPHLFDTTAAIARARTAELYISEGGVLEWPEPVREVRWLPTDPLLADVLTSLRGYRPTPHAVMGCLTAALPALNGHMPPVLGEPAPAQTTAVYQHLVQAGFDGAPMMLDDTVLTGGLA